VGEDRPAQAEGIDDLAMAVAPDPGDQAKQGRSRGHARCAAAGRTTPTRSVWTHHPRRGMVSAMSAAFLPLPLPVPPTGHVLNFTSPASLVRWEGNCGLDRISGRGRRGDGSEIIGARGRSPSIDPKSGTHRTPLDTAPARHDESRPLSLLIHGAWHEIVPIRIECDQRCTDRFDASPRSPMYAPLPAVARLIPASARTRVAPV
jgi:hypothetical protein